MKNIAIIPARGGSKRIPRKNIKEFMGQPIISYSIVAALKSNLFSEVMVSTDDEEIRDISLKYGANVPFLRSKENSNDFAGTMDVIKEVLNDYAKLEDKQFESGCCIYPTAPLIQIEHLKSGYELMMTNKLYSVFPVVSFSYPIWRGLEKAENNKIKMVWHEYLNKRSQDLKQVYHDAGQWYWFDISQLKESFFTDNTECIYLKETEVQDIDNEIDWKLAEMKFRLLNAE